MMKPFTLLGTLATILLVRHVDATCSHSTCTVGEPLKRDKCPEVHVAMDTFCTLFEWDDVCVGQAIKLGAKCPTFQPKSGVCPHSVCQVGVALSSNCDRCVERVLERDESCGTESWGQRCVDLVPQTCDFGCTNNYFDHLAFFIQRRQNADSSTAIASTTSVAAVVAAAQTTTNAVVLAVLGGGTSSSTSSSSSSSTTSSSSSSSSSATKTRDSRTTAAPAAIIVVTAAPTTTTTAGCTNLLCVNQSAVNWAAIFAALGITGCTDYNSCVNLGYSTRPNGNIYDAKGNLIGVIGADGSLSSPSGKVLLGSVLWSTTTLAISHASRPDVSSTAFAAIVVAMIITLLA